MRSRFQDDVIARRKSVRVPGIDQPLVVIYIQIQWGQTQEKQHEYYGRHCADDILNYRQVSNIRRTLVGN